jgi:hypothetical protein
MAPESTPLIPFGPTPPELMQDGRSPSGRGWKAGAASVTTQAETLPAAAAGLMDRASID